MTATLEQRPCTVCDCPNFVFGGGGDPPICGRYSCEHHEDLHMTDRT